MNQEKPMASATITTPVLSADEFKAAFREHPAGVSVITAMADGERVALTATSVASVSADPPLIMFSVSALSSSTPTILKAETVVIHLLNSDQLPIAKLGATHGIDRFADTSIWSSFETGEPYFPAVRAWIRARVLNRTPAGGSAVILVEALESQVVDDVHPPLVYHDRTWHALGDHSRIEGV
jgi:flavin reductase (DIM6/NTAB) family NADH-FMN oxidoreductase RutF